MRSATRVVVTGSMIVCMNAFAAQPNLPAAVAADLRSVADQCAGVGGRAVTENAVKRVDLNGDGKEDYVLDVASISCDGAPGIFGDREKMVAVYAGDGAGGAKQVFSDWVYGAKLEGTGASTRLWLTVTAEQCGKPPAKDFASESFCDRAIAWNARAQKFEYAPVSTIRMIE